MNQDTAIHRILFVCTGNTCRSPMAEALFNHLNPPAGWHAESAGMAAFSGEPASLLAGTALLVDYGLDLSGHRSQPVNQALLEHAEMILTMTTSQRDALKRVFPEWQAKIWTVGEMADEPERIIPDPFGRDLSVYQQTAAALAELIEKIAGKIRRNF